ncbi:MAG TPA: HEAT repeat domain-containing protein [Cytophagales bacterium]|nr:HEAT repeat domain-containing protein [Cytophagales bacterium]HRG08661.1 HEAT repeat domain-containing protein [Cyclobacteriaceae bacterium]
MDKQKWEGRLIDYIDGRADAAERAAIENELLHNEAVRNLYNQLTEVIGAMNEAHVLEPSGKLKANFEQALQEEIVSQAKATKTVFFSSVVYRVAAGFVLLMVGLAIGYKINQSNVEADRLARLEEELEENRQMMLAMMDNQLSASQRMIGVSVAYEMEKPDDEIVNVLVKTMNEDVNTNVRLAALDALGKFSNEEQVRNELISSLKTQKDPVVQIALIQLLVTMKEKGVLNQLEKITRDAGTLKAVKDEAHAGILKLS